MGNRRWVLPWVLALFTVSGACFAQALPPRVWVEAARGVPVAAEGRILPLDTWARVLYARATGQVGSPEALEWLLTHLVFPETAKVSLTPEARSLADTFRFDTPGAVQSPLVTLDLAHDGLNPAQALGANLPPVEKDRLALLVFWYQQSRAGAWDEAAQALRLFAGSSMAWELWYHAVPWAWLVAVVGIAGLGALSLFRPKSRGWLTAVTATGWLLVTAALVLRMVISARPPVTDLASSFWMVAWLSLGAALFLSLSRGPSITALVALAAGTLLPLVSLAFQGPGDPFSPLQAVLNNNFWLSVHATAIVAGYSATFLAGLLGHAYLGVSGGKKAGGSLLPLWKSLHCALVAALALTLAGTLLGGFWADQSWGRFWGWDPKENGALLIILWLALTLHLKPSGFTAEWGTALAAALVLPVLLFSWLGVNLLGLGFHSYGAAPGKALLFWGMLSADALVLAILVTRKVLR